ncbi:MAG: cytochrome c oxidase subunit II [Candidatus Symbiobacter sp.]|nr:cytochrome c oxidase subunit II [Candidatus Symbiobacter sp.]
MGTSRMGGILKILTRCQHSDLAMRGGRVRSLLSQGLRMALAMATLWSSQMTKAAFAAAAPTDQNGVIGIAEPWQMGMQGAFSPMRERLMDFHTLLLVVIVLIVILVMCLMAYIMYRFREKANPTPSHLTHNTKLEVAWTLLPALILVVIAIPSLHLLYYLDRVPSSGMTIKVSAHQWYWSYEYPDDAVKFDSQFAEGQEPRQLAVDNALVLPLNTNVRVLVSSTDVIHSWFIPSLGVQIYATPGRTNETWVRLNQEGTFYGQCNQICGVNHGFMPIKVIGLSQDKYAAWLSQAKTKFASLDAPTPVAANPAKLVAVATGIIDQAATATSENKAGVVMR